MKMCCYECLKLLKQNEQSGYCNDCDPEEKAKRKIEDLRARLREAESIIQGFMKYDHEADLGHLSRVKNWLEQVEKERGDNG